MGLKKASERVHVACHVQSATNSLLPFPDFRIVEIGTRKRPKNREKHGPPRSGNLTTWTPNYSPFDITVSRFDLDLDYSRLPCLYRQRVLVITTQHF